jgi:probable addiction module antidote protein
VNVKKLSPQTRAFIAEYRDNPRAIAKYLNEALSTGDTVHFTKSIGDIVRAQGVTRVAQKTGLERPGIYRSFSGKRGPPFKTVLNVLLALDLELNIKPSGSKQPALKAKGT